VAHGRPRPAPVRHRIAPGRHRKVAAHRATTWEGSPGDLLVIPEARRDFEAVQDAVVLLTVAKLA